jgi:hypothetical protein
MILPTEPTLEELQRIASTGGTAPEEAPSSVNMQLPDHERFLLHFGIGPGNKPMNWKVLYNCYRQWSASIQDPKEFLSNCIKILPYNLTTSGKVLRTNQKESTIVNKVIQWKLNDQERNTQD